MSYITEGENHPDHRQGETIHPLVALRAQPGDMDGFNELVLAYQDSVFQQAYWLTGQGCLAEDATQLAFLRAFQKRADFRGGSFKAWILKIVTNICFDALRHQKRHPVLSLDPIGDSTDEDEPVSSVVDPRELPEQRVERHEMITALQVAIRQLPFVSRSVLILVDIQELDYREAAAALHIPLGTVKSRLARARLQLRQVLLTPLPCKSTDPDENPA
jgi:RNA polymerase sigma-70 factor (ECF subfamily)